MDRNITFTASIYKITKQNVTATCNSKSHEISSVTQAQPKIITIIICL